MHTPPRYEKRPTPIFYAGQALATRLLTSSLLLNLLRLAALAATLPYGLLWLLDRGAWWPPAAAGAALLLSLWLRPPAAARIQPVRWSRAERRLAAAAHAAWQAGTATADALADCTPARQALDYGTTPAGAPVCVAPALRSAHQLIVGGSGVGKSKLVASQAAQAALLGRSLVVVDPHVELVHDLLCSVPELLAERGTILLWPDNPCGLIFPWNLLATSPERPAWKVADSVVGAVKRVWQLTEANTYIIDVVRHTAWALAAAGWTLLEAQRFLLDERFRSYIAEQADVPEVALWVTHFNALRRREQVDLAGTSLVRLARLQSNPYLKQLIGAGVRDTRYAAALAAEQRAPIAGAELGAAINRGQHVLAALPRQLLGEDQFLLAGLVQSLLLEAIFQRQPHERSELMTEAYLDEAATYATGDGLGLVLAQARKYRFSATVIVQGLHQLDSGLRDELKTNTAIKAVFATDHPDEALEVAGSLYHFDPLRVKVDARQRVGDVENRREVGAFQTYSPGEQQSFYASRISQLPPRHYLLKVRGHGDACEVVTPPVLPRYRLDAALRRLNPAAAAPLVEPAAILAELAWRTNWLDRTGYDAPRVALGGSAPTSAVAAPSPPTFGAGRSAVVAGAPPASSTVQPSTSP